jgi:hypothetical protein
MDDYLNLQNTMLAGCDGLGLVTHYFLAAFVHPSLKLPSRSFVLAFLDLRLSFTYVYTQRSRLVQYLL